METHIKEKAFYGRYAKFVRFLACLFSRHYSTDVTFPAEPVVYVCRHLNMHGPLTTLKWLPFHVHPMVLSVFCEKDSAIRQFREYTFSVRYGRKPLKHDPLAWAAGCATSRLMKSLQAVPTYREAGSIRTIRSGIQHLMNGESLIVWPDIAYTEGYDQKCEIYSGFLLMGDLYFRKTGKSLSFIPLYIDDSRKQIIAREPVSVNHFKQEAQKAAEYLQLALERHDENETEAKKPEITL